MVIYSEKYRLISKSCNQLRNWWWWCQMKKYHCECSIDFWKEIEQTQEQALVVKPVELYLPNSSCCIWHSQVQKTASGQTSDVWYWQTGFEPSNVLPTPQRREQAELTDGLVLVEQRVYLPRAVGGKVVDDGHNLWRAFVTCSARVVNLTRSEHGHTSLHGQTSISTSI